ncbi:MAG TPA: PQQ-binding-like beta-propeller repeat protein [Anaeromyxobacteraceae bacterium]|nr:PQQ-binding-like beta-propeller repeat protein [Anaeromyxobacteraceae bacterium]
MIRIRIGQGWATDPDIRAGLAGPDPAARRAALRAIVDVVAVELDGVDLAAGRTEGPVADGVLGMLRAIDRLAAGGDHASVPFEDGAVELVLHRRGGAALLSVATLSRPARLLAHDVEVDLSRLAVAAREAAVAFCERVAEVAPTARALPELRALLRAARRRPPRAKATSPERPPSRTRRTRRRTRDAACSFELHDERGRLATWRGPGADLASLLVPGRVAVRSPTGEEILAVDGAPYLLLRDLAEAAARIAASPRAPHAFELARPGRQAALRVALADGKVVAGRRPAVPCEPLSFARAVLEGAADFCAVVRHRAPAQASNELLADLERTAAQTLAHVHELREGDRTSERPRRIRLGPRQPTARPLASGRVRRVTFERIAALEVGPPAPEPLLAAGGGLVACGQGALLRLDPLSGEVAWSGRGAALAAASDDRVAALRDGVLEALDLATGEPLWSRPFPLPAGARTSMTFAPGRLLVATGHEVCAVDPDAGATLWAFASPGAARLSLLPLGPLLLAASDAGAVHALEADGRLAWRMRGPGPLSRRPVASARSCLVAFHAPAGGLLVAVDPSTGRRLSETPLDFTPAGAPCRFAGRVALPGRVAGEAILCAVDEDGTPAWKEPSPVGPSVALAPRPGGLLAKGPDGTCAALDRDGRVLWTRTCAGRPAAPGNLPPEARRGLVVVPAMEVDLLDDATGTAVGRLPGHGPARLLVRDDLTAWTVDADGLVCGARVRGHLAEVDGPVRPARR